jgi:hypothetical protein
MQRKILFDYCFTSIEVCAPQSTPEGRTDNKVASVFYIDELTSVARPTVFRLRGTCILQGRIDWCTGPVDKAD